MLVVELALCSLMLLHVLLFCWLWIGCVFWGGVVLFGLRGVVVCFEGLLGGGFWLLFVVGGWIVGGWFVWLLFDGCCFSFVFVVLVGFCFWFGFCWLVVVVVGCGWMNG